MKTIVMKTTKRMMLITMIAVVYVVISIFLAPFSFGPIQCRVSEALCVLPILSFYTYIPVKIVLYTVLKHCI